MSVMGQEATFHLPLNFAPFAILDYSQSSASMLRIVGRSGAISRQLSPSSGLANTEPLLVPKESPTGSRSDRAGACRRHVNMLHSFREPPARGLPLLHAALEGQP